MLSSKFLTKTVMILAALVFALSGVQPAYAQPSNDNFANAIIISTLPFSDEVDNTGATTESNEPLNCFYSPVTVWYSFTPAANASITANMAGSSMADTILSVYQAGGGGLGDLSLINCASYGGSAVFIVQAGTTYYLQAGSMLGVGNLKVNVFETPPPPNDDFADAKIISTLPFSDEVDNTGATTEINEPQDCSYNSPWTVWYSFTSAANVLITANTAGSNMADTRLSVYQAVGGSLGDLSLITCGVFGSSVVFNVQAGSTYYLQAGSMYGVGNLKVNVFETPPPIAGFMFYPFDPSTFDTIQFFDQSYDPGQSGFQSFVWDFGDGSVAIDSSPTHQYAMDGDYTVNYTVTTNDGRTASTSRVVQVKTHDVAITKITAPQSAKSGQTQKINIAIKNRRYSEDVRVDFYKSIPGGFQWVGAYTQFVPVRLGNQTSTFTFNYTFTMQDVNLGKVSFKAVATIVNLRDALPADNELISSPPTKITK